MILAVMCASLLRTEFYYRDGLPAVRLSGFGLEGVILTAGAYLLIRYAFEKKLRIEIAVLSLIFALCTVTGESYNAFGEWTLLLGGIRWVPFLLLSLTGFTVIFYSVLTLVSGAILQLMSMREHPQVRGLAGRALELVLERHPGICTFILILLCEIPYMLALFPGIVSFDGAVQIAQGMRWEHFTWHHPPFVSYLYGFFAEKGIEWGNRELGLFLIVMIQSILVAFAFSRAILCMKRLRIPCVLRALALIFYAVYPVWPTWAMTIIKDSLFYPLYLLFTCLLIELVCPDQYLPDRKGRAIIWAKLLVVGLMLCLTRNNGIYEVMLSLPLALFVVPRRERIALLAVVLILPASYLYIDRVIWPGLVDTDNVRIDRYTAQLQQTARYSIYHPDDVTPDERRLLDEILDVERMRELYDPENGDLVKEALRVRESERGFEIYEMTGREHEYERVWLAQGLRHPATYIQSYLNGCYGYLYPDRREVKEGLGWYEMSGIFDYYEVEENAVWADLRERIRLWTEQVRETPLIGMLYSCGFQTWCLMCCIAVLIICRRRLKAAGENRAGLIIPCLPGVVTILVNTVSPIDAYLRYMLPILVTLPLIAAWTWSQLKELRAASSSSTMSSAKK